MASVSAIQYIKGDATLPNIEGTKIIAHVCNNIGKWSKGFVAALSQRYTEPEYKYKEWYRKKIYNSIPFALGNVQIVFIKKDLYIANMIAQDGIYKKERVHPIRYTALDKCLNDLILLYKNTAKFSIHMPRISCDLSKDNWNIVSQIIEQTLCKNNIPVYIYDLN